MPEKKEEEKKEKKKDIQKEQQEEQQTSNAQEMAFGEMMDEQQTINPQEMVIPKEEDLPSPQEDEHAETGTRQNYEDRQAEMREAMYGTAMGASSGIEIAMGATPSQDGSEKSGEKPQSAPLEM